MVKLKEMFGRRMALVWLAVIAVAVCACVCSIGIFTANAATHGDDGGTVSGDGIKDGVFKYDEVMLTQNVIAPRNATFDTSYTYTFEGIDTVSTTDPVVDVKFSEWTSDLKDAINSPVSQVLRMKVDGGVIDETNSKCNKDGENFKKAQGNGKSGIGIASWDDDAQYPEKDTATLFGYIHELPITSILPDVKWGWLANPESPAEIAYVNSLFPKDGNYGLKVTCTQNAGAKPDDATWHTSEAEYTFMLCIGHEDGIKKLRGVVVWQGYSDWKIKVRFKKNPLIWPGWSFHPYYKEVVDGTPGEKTLVYEGFTFAHTLWQTPDGANYDPLTIKKGLSGNFHPRNDFDLSNINIYSNTWNYINEMQATPSETQPDTITGALICGDDVHEVQFTIAYSKDADGTYYEPAKASLSTVDGSAATTITVHDGDTLVFDGATHTGTISGSAETDKIPTGSWYELEEAAYSQASPQTGYKAALFAASATTASGTAVTSGYKIPFVTDPDNSYTDGPGIKRTYQGAKQGVVATWKGTDGTAGVNKNLIVGKKAYDAPAAGTDMDYINITYVQNHNDRDVYGFMVGCVPYIVLIGVPILAFAAWIIARKKRLFK